MTLEPWTLYIDLRLTGERGLIICEHHQSMVVQSRREYERVFHAIQQAIQCPLGCRHGYCDYPENCPSAE